METETVKLLERLTLAEKLDAIEFLAGSLRRAANADPASQSQNMRRLLQALANMPVRNNIQSRGEADAIYYQCSESWPL